MILAAYVAKSCKSAWITLSCKNCIDNEAPYFNHNVVDDMVQLENHLHQCFLNMLLV